MTYRNSGTSYQTHLLCIHPTKASWIPTRDVAINKQNREIENYMGADLECSPIASQFETQKRIKCNYFLKSWNKIAIEVFVPEIKSCRINYVDSPHRPTNK